MSREVPAFIAALPRELKPLVRGWREHKLAGNVRAYSNGFAVAACAGMGAARATLAVEAARAIRPVAALVSVGFAGACDPGLRAGDVVHAGVVVDGLTGERFANPGSSQVLVSAPAMASVEEKRRLYASYGASAVDMEAAAVARQAEAHGLAFQAIKAISDDAAFELDELGRFTTADGQFRQAAFARYALRQPRLWRTVVQLGVNSNRALGALTAALETQLDWYRKRT